MQDLKVAFFVALRSVVRGHKSTTALMIAVLSLSFVNLLFIAGILSGIVSALYQQVINNFTSNIVVEPQEEPLRKEFIIHQDELRRQIEAIPGVVATARHYKLAGTCAYDRDKNGRFKSASAEVVGIDPAREKLVTHVWRNMLEGTYLEGLGAGDIVLGADLAGGYGGANEITSLGGVKTGEEVMVTFSNGVARKYKVRGIFKVRFGFVDRLAFITTKEAESALSVYDSASQILVKVNAPPGYEKGWARRIRAIAPELEVRAWGDLMGEFTNVAKAFDMITLVVSTVGLAVAAATVFILIYVNAINKRRQIGILKAIGIKPGIIIGSYLLQSLFFALCGIVIGSALVFWAIAPYFASHPLRFPMGDTSLTLSTGHVLYCVMSLLVAGIMAGFVPAWRVTNENILEAIWGA